MNNLVAGQMVQVRNHKQEAWYKVPREFVWRNGGKYYCVNSIAHTELTAIFELQGEMNE